MVRYLENEIRLIFLKATKNVVGTCQNIEIGFFSI